MANYQLTQTGAQVQNLLNDISNKAPKASPALTGTPTAPTAANGTNTTQIATTAFVQTSITDKQDKKPNGTALLIDNSTGKINTAYIPDSLLGALVFGGIITSVNGPSGTVLSLTVTLTDSAKSILGISNDTCALYPSTDSTSSNIHADDCNNMFFILGVGSNVSFDGLEFNNGDWLIAVNDTWKKIDNTDSVASVNGKIGSVILKTSDLQNDSGYLTTTDVLSVNNGGTGENNRRKAGLFYNWTTVLQGKIWSRICHIPYTSSTLGSTMILNVRHTRSSVVYNETVMITVHHNYRGNITSLSSSNYNQNTSIQIRALVNSSGDCYIELKDSNQEIAEGTTISPVHCILQIITLGNNEPNLYVSFNDGTTLPENYSVAAEVMLGRNRIVTSGKFSGDLEGNAATASTAGGITSAGTTAQFWRGDNSWSNILAQPAATTLGIDTSNLRIGRAIRTLHIATSDSGTGAGITDGDAAGITFGFSNAAYNAAYAGIYYQSSADYGSRLYFATTNSFGNGAYARMMITHDGKVGIGTLSPSTRLHVDGGVTVTDLTASQAVSTNANKKLVSTNLTTADPTASGTGISYIATISQSATGKITATKSTIRSASTSQTGVLQFTSANTSAQINTLSTGSSVPYDDDYFISQYANGGTSHTDYYRRPISTLYTYIKNKALANESDFLPNLKVNTITIKTVSGEKSYLDIETLLRWFITTEKISTSLQYHKTFIVGWEFASNDYLQFTYDDQNYEFNLAGTVIEFIGKTTGINETTNKADGQFRLILHIPPANPPAQTAGYVVPGYGSYIKYSVNGSGTNRSSKLTFINNRPQYYANEKIEYAASYNKTPEVANIKINGNTSATAASTKNVQLVYDASLETLNFVFS